MNNEFYIGWESKAAPGIGKFVRRIVLLLLVTAIALALVFAAVQHNIGTSVFEWGTVKNFSGILKLEPYPHLLVPRPGLAGMQNNFSTYYLVAPFKFGLDREKFSALEGKTVSLQGTLIYRGNQTMVEALPDSIKAAATNSPMLTGTETIPLGRQTLTGEIVDSKCFLGVMNPGQLLPHRACAIRCISGGIPPVLLVRQTNGAAIYLVLDLVAEAVQITGEVERQGDLLILRADPSTYRRVE
jgi:hypothetical protein